MNRTEREDIIRIISRFPFNLCSGKVFVIAGATGFLGRYMVMTLAYLNRNILENKCEIIAICRDGNKAQDMFSEYMNEDYFHLLIQRVEDALPDIQRVDYIIHAASDAVTSKFELYPADIMNANVAGTVNLLNLARKHDVKKFLYFSSGAVYGNIPGDKSDISEKDSFPLDFTDISNCYAEGKRAGEALCRAYWKQYGIPTVSVRISHTYGPGINIDDGRVFSDFVKRILQRENLVIKGSGNDVRPFCYIEDAVTAFFLLLFSGAGGEAYNMANREETYTIKELADKLAGEVFPERNLSVEGDNLVKQKITNKQKINIEKLKQLGWEPMINIEEGFRRTVQSFEEMGY